MQVSQSPDSRLADRVHFRVLMAVLFAVIGILIFAQFRGERALRSVRVAASTTDRAALISGLVDANLALREEAASLEAQLAELEGDGGSLVVMVDELNRLRLVNGLSEVTGAGLTIALDSPMSATELQDLVNELKNSGAAAVSLNGQRLIAQSSIVSTEAGIAVDGTQIIRPFVLRVLGDPATLLPAVTRKGGLLSSLQAAHTGFRAQVDEEVLVMPIYPRTIEWKYAKPANPAP